MGRTQVETVGVRAFFRRAIFTIAAICGLAMGGCAPPAAQQAPPPPDVTVAQPVQRDVIQWDQYTGYIESPDMVDVEARVSGEIVTAPFVEGSIVQRGQTLFRIDTRPFKAALDQTVATVNKDKAAAELARLNFVRYQQAIASNAVSKQDYDNAKATLDQAYATLASDQAAVEQARLNVEWCNVIAPIDGRVSYKLVTPGNLVIGGGQQAPATLLTTIQSVNPIYCYVDVDENSVLKYRKLAAAKQMLLAANGQVPCYIQLGDETGFPHAGYLDFSDNHIDTGTGTQRVRGVFPNDQSELVPGFFAVMRIPGSARYTALLIPDAAVGSDQNAHYVMLVDSNNIATPRPVVLGALFGSMRSIVSGITPGDHVIIDGLMHARPGAAVKPTLKTLQIDPGDFPEPAPGENSVPTTLPVEDTAATEPLGSADRGATPTTQQEQTPAPATMPSEMPTSMPAEQTSTDQAPAQQTPSDQTPPSQLPSSQPAPATTGATP